jgi:hypothetical protein
LRFPTTEQQQQQQQQNVVGSLMNRVRNALVNKRSIFFNSLFLAIKITQIL